MTAFCGAFGIMAGADVFIGERVLFGLDFVHLESECGRGYGWVYGCFVGVLWVCCNVAHTHNRHISFLWVLKS